MRPLTFAIDACLFFHVYSLLSVSFLLMLRSCKHSVILNAETRTKFKSGQNLIEQVPDTDDIS